MSDKIESGEIVRLRDMTVKFADVPANEMIRLRCSPCFVKRDPCKSGLVTLHFSHYEADVSESALAQYFRRVPVGD